MSVFKVIAVCAVGLLIIMLLKERSREFSLFAEISVLLLLMLLFLSDSKELFGEVRALFSLADINSDILSILFKAFGILLAGSVVSDLCRDNGENALGFLAEIFVKASALLCAVPVFSAVIKIAMQFIS